MGFRHRGIVDGRDVADDSFDCHATFRYRGYKGFVNFGPKIYDLDAHRCDEERESCNGADVFANGRFVTERIVRDSGLSPRLWRRPANRGL
jgi:hypothetical protein